MAQAKNAFEIFQCLEKSNCRECGEKTCLAFAGAVFLGHRKITECPRLIPEAAERFAGKQVGPKGMDTGPEDRLEVLKSEVPRCDLEDAARRVGGKFSDNRLILKVLGRDFRVDTSGNLFAEIHINPWVAVPFLQYILHGKGLAPTGRWVSFRDLKGGRESHPLFQKRIFDLFDKKAFAPDLAQGGIKDLISSGLDPDKRHTDIGISGLNFGLDPFTLFEGQFAPPCSYPEHHPASGFTMRSAESAPTQDRGAL